MAPKKKPKLSKVLAQTAAAAPPVVIAPPDVTRKLDLACGQTPREGFEGVDIWPGAKHVVDLTRYPWTCHCTECQGKPFADSSVAELHCSHYIEHIDMLMVDKTGAPVWPGDPQRAEAKDALFAFFDEAFRILVPGGWFDVIVPSGRSDRGFQDPTHRRFIVESTFAYLFKPWRDGNKLDHYNVLCNFGGIVNKSVPAETNMLHPEAQVRHFTHYWNAVFDWHVRLQSLKQPTVLTPTP